MSRMKWVLLLLVAVAAMAVVAVPAGATHSQFHPDCHDGIDNDGDGLIDYPADPGCTSLTDEDETDPAPPPPTGKVKCNSGRGNGSEINLATGLDCDPGNSGGHNNGGD
jgi:hypothetical protein